MSFKSCHWGHRDRWFISKERLWLIIKFNIAKETSKEAMVLISLQFSSQTSLPYKFYLGERYKLTAAMKKNKNNGKLTVWVPWVQGLFKVMEEPREEIIILTLYFHTSKHQLICTDSYSVEERKEYSVICDTQIWKYDWNEEILMGKSLQNTYLPP